MSELEAFSLLVLILALIPALACITIGVVMLYVVLVSPITFVFNKIHKLTKINLKIIYFILGIPFFYYSYGLFINTLVILIKLFGNFISSFI